MTEDHRVIQSGKNSTQIIEPSLVSSPPQFIKSENENKTQDKNSPFRLGELNNRSEEEATMLTAFLGGRVKENKKEYEAFLEKQGLMGWYDGLWELGVNSLDELAEVSIESFNKIKMPAGFQIRLQRELKRVAVDRDHGPKDIAIETEMEPPEVLKRDIKEIKLYSSSDRTKPLKDQSFATAQVMNKSIGIDPLPYEEGSMPLNVDSDSGGPGVERIIVPKNFKKGKKAEQLSVDQGEKKDSNQTSQGARFTFASLGPTSWENILAVPTKEEGTTVFSKVIATSVPPKKTCFCCFRRVEENEAIVHRLLPDKVGRANRVLLLSQML